MVTSVSAKANPEDPEDPVADTDVDALNFSLDLASIAEMDHSDSLANTVDLETLAHVGDSMERIPGGDVADVEESEEPVTVQPIEEVADELPIEPAAVADPVVTAAEDSIQMSTVAVAGVSEEPTEETATGEPILHASAVEEPIDDEGTLHLLVRRTANLRERHAKPAKGQRNDGVTQKALLKLIDNNTLDLKEMTETVNIDESEQRSEFKYWQERMSRAKKHVETKKELVATAGSFCNAALSTPLPAADLAIVNEALEGNGDPTAIIVSAPGVYINRREFQRLNPRRELMESVIDFYMHCIRQRQNRLFHSKKTKRQFYYFRTGLQVFIHHPYTPSEYDYSRVQRWTRRNVPHNDIFKCDAVFFLGT